MKTVRPTRSGVARILEKHPEVKKVRLDTRARKVNVGFYETPPDELLARIKTAVRQELAGEWGISIEPAGGSPLFHLHKIDNDTVEFHRKHPAGEPRLIWKRIPLPAWRNRPFPPAVKRDYRIMLWLAGICGLSTLAGFVLHRAGFAPRAVAPFFVVAYLTGGWFATQDVWRALKRGKIDVQFLMMIVALGAAIVGA